MKAAGTKGKRGRKPRKRLPLSAWLKVAGADADMCGRAEHWSAKKALAMAQTFEQWAGQLRDAVALAKAGPTTARPPELWLGQHGRN